MPKQQTYEVHVSAIASRIVKVRAGSAREAWDKVADRVPVRVGAWGLDLPGTPDEHYDVFLGGEHLGPDNEGDMNDEPDAGDDDQDDGGEP